QWTAQFEVGYGFKAGFEAYLRYQRIQFKGVPGANVILPMLIYYVGPMAFSARYFLSIDDTGKVTQAAIGKVQYYLGDRLEFYLGGGGGNHADYLDLRGYDTQYFWTIIAGVWWNITWQHRLMFNYTFRDEEAGGQSYLQNYLITGYQVRF
ncbi:MAG: hypothetical protein WC889_14285, partial [Myxococcota bacterium]